MQRIINFLILFIVVLLPTSILEKYLPVHPAIFAMFLLFLIVLFKTLLTGKIIKISAPVKFFIFILFLIFLLNILSLAFAPPMPEYADSYNVSGLMSPNSVRAYGVFSYLKSAFFVLTLILIPISKQFFQKIIKYHILTSFIVSSFGILSFIYFLLTKKNVFGIITGWIMPRLYSVSIEPQAFASYLLTAIPFIIYALLQNSSKFFSRKNLLLFLIIDVIAFVLTFSTGGFIAAAVIFIFFLFLIFLGGKHISKKQLIRLFTVFIIVIVVVFSFWGDAIFSAIKKLTNLQDASISSAAVRINFWKVGIEMAKDHFLLGVGPESYGYFYEQYAGQKSPEALVQPPQNIIIGMTANLGIFGGILFLLVFLISFWLMFKHIKVKDSDVSLFAKSLSSVILALFVQHLTFWAPYAFFFWFFIGFILSFYNNIIFLNKK